MMNLMIYFIIKLSLNNCQNIFLSYSNNDESVKDNKFYNDFHLSHNKIFKEDKKINQTFNNYSKNIKINNILYNVTFNNISSFKDYNNNLIIYSPNPITIFIYGNLIINKEENVFKFKKNIFFYSIKEIDFQMNNITLEFKFKYKKIKRFKDLILKNKLNYTLYIPILSILDNELIPIIIKDIEKNLKKNLTLRYKEIFKKEEIQFYLANFFGEFDFYLINEKNGFCQSINNSERIFCPLSGIVSNKKRESKKNINGKKEFIEDINLLNFTENENGLYINYFVFDQIFQFIHQNFYYFTLTNYNKPSYLPYMNVDYLKQFFHNIGSYYILSEQFSLEISIVNYEKVNLTNGYMGFCAEKHNQPPRMTIQTNNMTLIRNTFNHKDVSEYLKILFYVFVDHVDDINKLGLQELVWQFTHEDFENSSNEQIKHTVELYNSGFRVNTLNAVKTLKNGTLMVYNFASAITTAVEQNMFLFRFEYRNNTNQSVDKKALNKTVFVGDEFKYEITVKNTGNETLNEVYIEDVDYTSNMMFLRAVNGTGNWVYSNKTLEVLIFDWNNLTKSEYRNITSRWILTSSLQPGENATIILIFKALSNGTAINNITSGFKNLEIANATNNETKIYNPNLTVEKITITPIVKPGSLTTFKIIVTNTGDVDLNDVFVVESSYFGLEYDSFEGVNWMKTGNKFNYLPTLKIGENASFNITFKAVISGNLTNIVIAGSNETDNKTGNNTTKVLKPDIKISKITLNKTVKVGEEVVFEIIVENTGELDLDNVFVRESKYDAELVYQRYVSNNGNWMYSLDENKHKFSLNDTLKVGESASFYVIFIATAIGEFSNTATVGYDNKTLGNSTNTTEVVNKTNPNENTTNPDKPTPPIHKPPIEKKTNKKTQIKKHIDKATGNPLIILLLALFILPIRRFIK